MESPNQVSGSHLREHALITSRIKPHAIFSLHYFKVEVANILFTPYQNGLIIHESPFIN